VATGYFAKEWPYQSRFKRVNGWRVRYLNEEPAIPLFSYTATPLGDLYGRFVNPLTCADRRVIALT
jgi:hypothetical protein